MPWEFLNACLEFLVAGLRYVRFAFKRNQSRSWPRTSGTVQAYRVEEKRGLLGLLGLNRYLSVFGYAFSANESRYAGFFALEADSEEMAQTIQRQAVGITVTVRYNSSNPDVSLLEDEMILGRKTIQNPHWLP